jgi:ubiquitin C-terminal hydrolase
VRFVSFGFSDACDHGDNVLYRMKIKKLPNVLALHLKRFKYQEDLRKYIKLTYRVAFPFELRLFNTVDEVDDPDRLYELFGIVVHIGRYNTSMSLVICLLIAPHIQRSSSWALCRDC